MRPTHLLRLCLAGLVLSTGAAFAQSSTCVIEPFQGATLPRGAVAQMRMANTGRACAIVNYGAPAQRSNPADSGNITHQAAHGKAEFVAPDARYTPEPGYVGDDEFEYEAFARGRIDQRVRLKVLVKVHVRAP